MPRLVSIVKVATVSSSRGSVIVARGWGRDEDGAGCQRLSMHRPMPEERDAMSAACLLLAGIPVVRVLDHCLSGVASSSGKSTVQNRPVPGL